jgi:hypothetical protein
MPRSLGRLLAVTSAAALLVTVGISVYVLGSLARGCALVAVFVWTAWPGVLVARRLYGRRQSGWTAAFLIGPVWGFALTSVVLLALWTAGVRHPAVLALAPVVAALVAIPCGRLAGLLTPPAFEVRDLAAAMLVLCLVPLVDGRPYARVGEMRPEGKAYRAYFIADFVWAMTVVAEVGKGEVPPQNPFMKGDDLHYYWLADLLAAIEYRVAGRSVSIEQVILTNALMLDVAFLAFFYFFVRHFVRSPSAAALGCVAAILFTSLEGTERLYLYWTRHVPYGLLRQENIDAISNWKFGSLKVDGLQRLLLWQPHHATAWAVSLSALLIVARQARDNGRGAVNLLAGTLLAVGLLLSSFLAVMIGIVVALYQLLTLASAGRWRQLAVGGVCGAIPVGIAVLVSDALEYVDRTGQSLVVLGVNPLAATNTWVAIALSFGPILVAAAAGGVLAIVTRARHLTVLALMVAVGFGFYFFVDVIDHQHAYVGFRSGHLLFMAFAPLVGFALQELWSKGVRTRVATALITALLALSAAPTTAIDLYNAQDTANQQMGPGFHWTVILTPEELEAFQWIKASTPADAIVQVEPHARDSETWAYMPAFGERRMAAGIPISMIPVRKYRDASEPIRGMYAAADLKQAYVTACGLGIDYLFVGPAERNAYPHVEEKLGTVPYWFRPAFRNGSVTIYRMSCKSES